MDQLAQHSQTVIAELCIKRGEGFGAEAFGSRNFVGRVTYGGFVNVDKFVGKVTIRLGVDFTVAEYIHVVVFGQRQQIVVVGYNQQVVFSKGFAEPSDEVIGLKPVTFGSLCAQCQHVGEKHAQHLVVLTIKAFRLLAPGLVTGINGFAVL